MTHNITLIPGDGIGPEVVEAAVRVVEATGVRVDWDRHDAGAEVYTRYGTTVPDEVFTSLLRNRVGIKGPITTPVGTGFASANVLMRQRLQLYANVRPVKTLPGIQTPFPNVDLIVVRENSEGMYSGLEHQVVPGVVESLKVVTEKGSTRIAQYAFELARRLGRQRVTAVHKANIMKLSDGLFLDCFRKVARQYSDIQADELIIDNTCMQLVMRPERFDVMVMENLYGDIVSDLCAGLIGGLGLTASVNVGESCSLYEAVHGSAPDIAGQNKANPIALIQCAAMMLRDLRETDAADRVEKAVHTVLREGKTLTPDLGGSATTSEITDAIIAAM
ncbi:MAG: isocitrate dehydrogenase (NAD(+)) [Fimbriimonadia bacterium]|jgi:isocitrate dehydrogenase (NAD+)